MKQAADAEQARKNWSNLHNRPDKRQLVQSMFARIADTYDLLNHLLSLNMDRLWRKKAVKAAKLQPGRAVLDLCCGTGDLTLEFARQYPDAGEIIGVDFVPEMLEIARTKQRNMAKGQSAPHKAMSINWLCADACRLPLTPNRFDCVSCAFGVRNLAQPQTAINQAWKVLKPHGKLVILEFDMPANPVLSWIYQGYFRLVIPLIGGIISGGGSMNAYRYLPESVRTFGTAAKLKKLIEQAGFGQLRITRLCGGTVLLFVAQKNE